VKEKIFKTLSQYKKILEDKGFKVIYIGLYGSQNYNVSDEISDIDVKAIILPSLHDIIFRKVTSTTIECENGSIDVKDLITFYDVIKKGDFSYIEAIDTEYSIGDKYIKNLFKQFRPNLKSILGAMYEKRKALTHEYPSKKEEFKKWGFDPKQFHHIIRLLELLKSKTDNSYLVYNNLEGEIMIKIKRNIYNYPKDFAEYTSDLAIEQAKDLIPKDYKYESINVDSEICSYIETNLTKELINVDEINYVETFRTRGNNISKQHLKKFPKLKELKDSDDVRYTIYESIEIL